MHACVPPCRCSQQPEECVGFPEAGIATGCELSNTGAGTEFELSRKAVGALNF